MTLALRRQAAMRIVGEGLVRAAAAAAAAADAADAPPPAVARNSVRM